MNPTQLPLGHQGWLRPSAGAAIGIAVAGVAGLVILGSSAPALPWLLAPAGASAVLVFAVPASPLAQPWPLIGGNVISATIGITVGTLLGAPLLAGAVAMGLAIMVMSLLRCLHPPGGACTLLYAMGAAGAETWGMLHVLTIATNILALCGTCWLYGRVTGQHWPHRPALPVAPVPVKHSAEVHSALTQVLQEWDEVIDADIDDLDAIFLAVEQRLRTGANAPAPVLH